MTMCEQRERLIGFVYEECSDLERREMQAHLSECPDCRREVGALRQVRQDLLSWEVPEHESVWRPLPTSRPVFTVTDIPAWAFAMAASLVFAAGIAGSALTYAFMPRASTAIARSNAQAAP